MIARANSPVLAVPTPSSVQVLLIRIAAMPEGDNIHGALIVVHGVNHAVVSDADSPKVLLALQPSASIGARFFSQSFYLRKDSADDSGLKRFEFLSR